MTRKDLRRSPGEPKPEILARLHHQTLICTFWTLKWDLEIPAQGCSRMGFVLAPVWACTCRFARVFAHACPVRVRVCPRAFLGDFAFLCILRCALASLAVPAFPFPPPRAIPGAPLPTSPSFPRAFAHLQCTHRYLHICKHTRARQSA